MLAGTKAESGGAGGGAGGGSVKEEITPGASLIIPPHLPVSHHPSPPASSASHQSQEPYFQADLNKHFKQTRAAA